MALTGKQKRLLKARGQTMSDDIALGKAGFTTAFLEHLGRLLERRELVKVRFADVEGAERKVLARELCAAAGSECVGIVGRTILLYRANPDLQPGKRALPGTG
jgi:RNA-binding protein